MEWEKTKNNNNNNKKKEKKKKPKTKTKLQETVEAVEIYETLSPGNIVFHMYELRSTCTSLATSALHHSVYTCGMIKEAYGEEIHGWPRC